MNVFDVVKGVLSIAVDIGTGVIIGNYTGAAVKAAKGVYKVCAGIASVAIGGVVSVKATDWINDQINTVQEKIENLNTAKEVNTIE